MTKPKKPWRLDFTGQKFNRLTVIGMAVRRGNNGEIYWSCRCDCGIHKDVVAQALRLGLTVSCGCHSRDRHTTHGMVGTPTYVSWAAMKNRCMNPHSHAFKNYGGRGITVHQRWRDFASFHADMGERPADMSLDRINNDGNYEPGNCRWADTSTQRRNRRSKREMNP